MANRHLARSIVMQTLFEWDFNNATKKDAEIILARNAKEFAPGIGDFSFVKSLLGNILKKQKTIDSIIEKAAPDWPIDKISIVDRNVLRIGLYELLFSDRKEVPPKVAINEAIEIAKTFSGEVSGKFINGVLGAVYRELGEPGKNESSDRRKVVNLSKLPLEKLGGAVVFSQKNKNFFLALVHDVFGRWTLSKGKVEKDENIEDATKREIKEEIGVVITIKEKLGENEYIASDPERGKIRKRVTYFLAETPYHKLTLGTSGGLDDAKWFPLEEIQNLKMYNDILPIIAKGIILLTKKHK